MKKIFVSMFLIACLIVPNAISKTLHSCDDGIYDIEDNVPNDDVFYDKLKKSGEKLHNDMQNDLGFQIANKIPSTKWRIITMVGAIGLVFCGIDTLMTNKKFSEGYCSFASLIVGELYLTFVCTHF